MAFVEVREDYDGQGLSATEEVGDLFIEDLDELHSDYIGVGVALELPVLRVLVALMSAAKPPPSTSELSPKIAPAQSAV